MFTSCFTDTVDMAFSKSDFVERNDSFEKIVDAIIQELALFFAHSVTVNNSYYNISLNLISVLQLVQKVFSSTSK